MKPRRQGLAAALLLVAVALSAMGAVAAHVCPPLDCAATRLGYLWDHNNQGHLGEEELQGDFRKSQHCMLLCKRTKGCYIWMFRFSSDGAFCRMWSFEQSPCGVDPSDGANPVHYNPTPPWEGFFGFGGNCSAEGTQAQAQAQGQGQGQGQIPPGYGQGPPQGGNGGELGQGPQGQAQQGQGQGQAQGPGAAQQGGASLGSGQLPAPGGGGVVTGPAGGEAWQGAQGWQRRGQGGWQAQGGPQAQAQAQGQGQGGPQGQAQGQGGGGVGGVGGENGGAVPSEDPAVPKDSFLPARGVPTEPCPWLKCNVATRGFLFDHPSRGHLTIIPIGSTRRRRAHDCWSTCRKTNGCAFWMFDQGTGTAGYCKLWSNEQNPCDPDMPGDPTSAHFQHREDRRFVVGGHCKGGASNFQFQNRQRPQ